ncbi:MAG: hypothetical protein J7M26_02160 [Armatimonadetes bacterium]|nr:hypothetical protein [Armatimonadota bacterium]
MMSQKLKPGDEAKVAGQYIVVDADGNRVPDTPEYTLAKGDTAPPTPGKGMAFMLVDASERATAAGKPEGPGFGGRARSFRPVAAPQRGLVPQAQAGESQ